MNKPGETYGYGKFAGDGADVSHWKPPQRLRVTADGEQVIEKVPSMLHMKMLSPGGNVVNVSIANGMGPVSPSDPYKIRMVEQKKAAGFIPWGRCPKAIGLAHFLPKDLQESAPCKLAEDGHAIGSEHPCKCVLVAKDVRQGKHSRLMQEIEDRHKTKEMRETAQRETQIEKQSSAIDKLTDLVGALSGKPVPPAPAPYVARDKDKK